MAQVARQCTKCETVDVRRTWKSTKDAAEEGALDAWTCPSCAWPEAELIEVEPQATNA